MFITPSVPQVAVEPYAAMRFCVRNEGARTWFEYEVDLMDKKGNGLKAMLNEITGRRNKFAFLVFRKIEEDTASWLEGNGGAQHRADIRDIHDMAHKLKDEIRLEHHLSNRRVGEYEGQVPAIRVSIGHNSVHIISDDWFDAVVGKAYHHTVDMDHLYGEIKDRFRVFATMVCGKLEREIKNTLLDVEKAFFRDRWLTAVKTDFDQRITVPTLELKRWVGRVSAKTDSSGRPNPYHIPGMDVLAGWDLTRPGPSAQTYVIKALHDGGKLEVLGVENQPDHPGTNPDTGKKYDVDILLGCDGVKIPVQVGVREGELARKLSDATVCLGEEIQPNEAVSEFGGTNMDYGKEPDFVVLREKLEQVPPGGVVLWASSQELLPGSGPIPLKEWYGKIMDKKCVIVWMSDVGKAVVHHNDTGFDQTLARKLCMALGVAKPDEQTDSVYSLTDDYTPDSVEGELRQLASKSGYSGRPDASAVVSVDDSALVLRHVVEGYMKPMRLSVAKLCGVWKPRRVVENMKSTVDNADDGEEWRQYVWNMLSILENIAKADNIKLDSSVWVEVCRILGDVVAARHDDYPCETLSYTEIDGRLHLQALFCVTHAVYRLRDKTPPEARKMLTAAARLGGQDGRGHRIVLGYALAVLMSAIPDWYAKNESLLFGEDSPDGMSSVLMRVYLHDRLPDKQTMEKHHTLVLEALADDMLDRRMGESETENRAETNNLVRHVMVHVLYGSRGYGVEDSVRNLASIGPDAVSVAGHECGFLIHDENTEKKFVERAVQFWEAVLDSSPEPAELYGFGWWTLTKSIDRDVWERLMLRTCEAAGGLVEDPHGVIDRASSDGNPTESGIRIVELVRRANKHL